MPAYFDKGLMVGQSAWHGLGTVIDADDERRFDIASCIELADMDDEIVLGDCYYVYGEGDNQVCDQIEGRYATIRKYADGSLKPLGVVGTKYTPLQPRAAFEWFQPWLETREVSIETAGTLRGGTVDWVMARILRGNIDLGGSEEIAKYLLLSTSHDGTKATSVGFTPQRVVCSNTLAMAHQSDASKLLRVRHTASQGTALSTIRETIDMVDQEFNATAAQYRMLMNARVSLADLRNYLKMVNDVNPDTSDKALGGVMRNRINRMVDLAMDGIGNEGATFWSAYNGVTQYLTHEYGSDNEKRVWSMMQGASRNLNRNALDLAIELAS